MAGEKCGHINEDFKLPNETRASQLSSDIIHRSQGLNLTMNGTGDFPFPVLNNYDPERTRDRVSLQMVYFRSFSDTLTYPSLPAQPVIYSQVFTSAGLNQITIADTTLQRFPVNGTIAFYLARETGFILQNRDKGQIIIEIRQDQEDYLRMQN